MRLLTILFLCLMVGACSATYTKTPVKIDGKIQRTWWGGIAYEKVRKSHGAVLSDNLTAQTKAVAESQSEKVNACEAVLNSSATTATGEAEKFRAFSDCMRGYYSADTVAVALGRPRTDVEALAQSNTKSIEAIEEGKTARTGMITRPLRDVGISVQVRKGHQSSVNATRDVGVEAARTGNVNIAGDVIASTSQSSSATSSDGGAGGEMGSGGDGVGTATSTGDTGDVNLNIGTANSAAMASEDARVFVDTENTQQLDGSANGAITDGSKITSQQIADELNDAPEQIDDRDDVSLLK